MSPRDREDAAARFERSMAIDYEKWHDGIGYDVDAIDDATPAERERIERLLLARRYADWRDVEALARLRSPAAEAELRTARERGSTEGKAMTINLKMPDITELKPRIVVFGVGTSVTLAPRYGSFSS